MTADLTERMEKLQCDIDAFYRRVQTLNYPPCGKDHNAMLKGALLLGTLFGSLIATVICLLVLR